MRNTDGSDVQGRRRGAKRHRQKEVAEVVAGKRDGRVAVGGRRVRRGTW